MLNGREQVAFDFFLEKVETKKSCILNAENKGYRKITIINELALTFQALDYRVFILTPFSKLEYLAEQFLTLDSNDYLCKFGKEKCVVLIDGSKRKEMDDFLEYCECRNVPVIGYVDYEGII
jgi:hypothetical protein